MWVQVYYFISVLRNEALLLEGNIQVFLTYHGKLLWDIYYDLTRIWRNGNRRNISSHWILPSVFRTDEIEINRVL